MADVCSAPWPSLPARSECTYSGVLTLIFVHVFSALGLIRRPFFTLINIVRRRELGPMVRASTGLAPLHIAAPSGRLCVRWRLAGSPCPAHNALLTPLLLQGPRLLPELGGPPEGVVTPE